MSANSIHDTRPAELVGQVMVWPVATVATSTTLTEVIQVLGGDEIGAVAVLEHDKLVGIVSERDIVAHLAQDANPDNVTAGEVMATDLVTARSSETLLDAARLMSEAGVRHLPVLDDAKLVGFLSIRAVVDALIAR